ncbi:hypothetical protein MUCCIDRAFT_94597 [Mucor lusitanicus CBS 277.49]|uniref:FAR1 domain-containing protein n=2 Tax=Mucor circinelloides f. lusitanicus TaxID=29924 RepID=A0A168MPQ8_MUCCL|nr:hypothetical protein MUCCIDRAFT_94597 [Mucor lusitanicus CBS 277.49]
MLENDRHEDDLIKVRQNFDSINDIRQAAIRYARRHKFAVSTLRSGARQLVLVCKHSGAYRATKSKPATPNGSQPAKPEEPSSEAKPPTEAAAAAADATAATAAADSSPTTPEAAGTSSSKKNTRKKLSQKIQCPFEIRAKPMGSSWIIYKVNYEHNHEMASDIKAYAQHRKLSPETKQLIIDLMNSGSTNSTIMEYLQLKGIDNVLKKDIANVRQAHFNNKSKKAADSSDIYQPTLQTTAQESKPASASCAVIRNAAAATSTDNNMDPSTTANTNMTTDSTTTHQPQQQDEQQAATEGEQLYQFISQNNVQVS